MRKSYLKVVMMWEKEKQKVESSQASLKKQADAGNKYAEFLYKRQSNPDNILYIPRKSLQGLSVDLTFDLVLLMDYQMKYHPNCEADNDGWFPCDEDILKLALSTKTRNKATNKMYKLVDAEYINRRFVDDVAGPEIKINYKRFLKGLR